MSIYKNLSHLIRTVPHPFSWPQGNQILVLEPFPGPGPADQCEVELSFIIHHALQRTGQLLKE